MDPIFILSGGGRTGSTLLQRLCLSTKQVLVWGEHRGAVSNFLRQIIDNLDSLLASEGKEDVRRFLEEGYEAWLPNMNPPTSAWISACRNFLDTALGQPASRMGYPRWGFKEIRYGRDDALFLQRLYPDARFLLVVRSPVACLQSIASTDWYEKDYGADPHMFLERWAQLSGELFAVQKELQHVCFLRYEDFVAFPIDAIARIAKTTGIESTCFDLNLFENKQRGSIKEPARTLQPHEVQALLMPSVVDVAHALDYALPVSAC